MKPPGIQHLAPSTFLTPHPGKRLEPADVNPNQTVVVVEDGAEPGYGSEPAPADGASPESPALVIRSVDRALHILELILDAPGSLRLQEIAAATGLKSPTCHHLVSSLVARGFVTRHSQPRTYGPGPRIASLLRRGGPQPDLGGAGHATLETLARATRCTTCLATLADTTFSLLDDFAPPRGLSAGPYRADLGLAPHAAALGKAILAWLPETQIAKVVAAHGLAPRTAHTITSLGELVESLRQTRRHGFAIEDREYQPDVLALACAIRNRAGAVIGSIACLAPAHGDPAATLRALHPHVHAAARDISARCL